MRKFLDIMNGITPAADDQASEQARPASGGGMRLDEGVFSFMRSLVGKKNSDADLLNKRIQSTREPPPVTAPASAMPLPKATPRSHPIGPNVVQPTSHQWSEAKDLMGNWTASHDAQRRAAIKIDLRDIAASVPQTRLADRITKFLDESRKR